MYREKVQQLRPGYPVSFLRKMIFLIKIDLIFVTFIGVEMY
jgi:hypothetical protein